MLHSFPTPSKLLSAFIPTIVRRECLSLTTHEHLPLNCSEAITVVNTINGLSVSNVKPFLLERQQRLHEIVSCALAEKEAFGKSFFLQTSWPVKSAQKKSWSYACYPKIAPSSITPRFSAKLTHAGPGSLPAERPSTRAEGAASTGRVRALRTGSQGGESFQYPSILRGDRQLNRVLGVLLKEICLIQILSPNRPPVLTLFHQGKNLASAQCWISSPLKRC